MLLSNLLLVQGQWTFDRRGRLFLGTSLLLIPGIIAHRVFMDSSSAELAWTLGCFAVSACGQAFRMLTIGSIPRGTSGRKRRGPRARTLNTTGVYSIVRNPLYVGNSLVHLGLIATTRSPVLVLVYCLLLVIYYERILLAEEHFLLGTYEDKYAAWADRTPAFFPRLSSWVKPEKPFSWVMVLRREGPGLSGLFCSYFVVQSAYRSVEAGRFVLDYAWLTAAAIAVSFYMLCKLGRKYTTLLDVSEA